jgi:hypothetical protein
MARAAVFHIPHRGIGIARIGRIDEHSHANCPGHELAQEFQLLCHQLKTEKIDAGGIAARPGEAGDKTEPDRVFGGNKGDRDRRGCRLGSGRRGGCARGDYSDPPANQFGLPSGYFVFG